MLKQVGLGGLAAGLAAVGVESADAAPIREPVSAASMIGVQFEKRDTVRIGIVGTGLRGRSMLDEWLGVEGVRITALCDVVPEKVSMAVAQMKKAGHNYEPALYTSGERAFESLCARDDIDLVYTATPWEWHVPVCLTAMRNGKHAATEVPAAYTLEDCWKLVDTSESTRRHCLMMENCCYGANELTVLNMCRAGVFGELKHGGAAYNHDLREILFENRDEGLWRRAPHTRRNGNLYPTHGLGPVAWYMGINRGDRFESMVSMSTPEFGLTKWRADHEPRDSAKWQERYTCGDVNISLIKTARGRVIRLEHDVTSPRPYSRINMIQGTLGLFEDYPPRVYVEGREAPHSWGTLDTYKGEFTHQLWRSLGDKASGAGHGGMDYIMAWRAVQWFHEGLAPDFDVYDAAAWSAPGPLSEQSVAKGGAPMRFPDFTRGAWREAKATAAL
jgi:hypothetical protein